MIIPLALSSFTYLWNPLGYPPGNTHDEGIYLQRTMHVLNGLGPQENPNFYDHPYFSQLFIAAYFWLIGFPDSLNPSSEDIDSVKGLFLFPKLLMGILAVFDTFLIYLIAQHRYNRRVAFVASMLFAGMPLPLLFLRRVWLEPIQLPFILSSILFALWLQRRHGNNDNETRTKEENDDDNIKENQSKHNSKTMTSPPPTIHFPKIKTRRCAFLFTIISGAFLGIAIFTKVPAFTFTPLIGFLIYNNNSDRNRKKTLFFLWLVPLFGIAMVWPMYAFSIGHISEWVEGILWQTNREGGRDLFYSLQYDLAIDPVLLILGGAGFIYAIIRKDSFILLWIIPFFVFLYLIGFVSSWHLIPALPAFCMAIARMIDDVSHMVLRRVLFFKQIIPILVILAIVTTEIAYTAPLIISGSNENFFSALTFVIDYLKESSSNNNNTTGETSEHKKILTVIGDPSYL
jgi:4-amino-4-deoxy-L-arabinose transferase-like glycosyltransferase